jgi:hypothetical protein
MADFPEEIFAADDAELTAETTSGAAWLRALRNLRGALVALGTNPAGAYGTVKAWLTRLEAVAVTKGRIGFAHLVLTNHPGAENTLLDVSADRMMVDGYAVEPLALTVDGTVVGKGGQEAAGTFAANRWLYVWVGYNAITEEVCAVLSQSRTRAGLILANGTLVGFGAWQVTYAIRVNAAAHFARVYILNGRVVYMDDPLTAQPILPTTAVNLVPQQVNLTAFLPPHARILYVGCVCVSGVNAGYTLRVRPHGGPQGIPIGATQPVANQTFGFPPATPIITDAAQLADWYTSQAPAGGTVMLYAGGYEEGA